jgi:hypothetical protein
MQDGVLAVNDAHYTHVVERNDPPDGGGDAVENLLELQSLGGDLGDFSQDAGYGLGVDRLDNAHAVTPDGRGGR